MVGSNLVKLHTLTKRKFGHSFRENTVLRLREKTGIYRAKRAASEETIPAVSGKLPTHIYSNTRVRTWSPCYARQMLCHSTLFFKTLIEEGTLQRLAP